MVFIILEIPSSAVNTHCPFRNAWYMCYGAIGVCMGHSTAKYKDPIILGS